MNLLQEIESAERGTAEAPSAIEKLILKHAMQSFGRRGYAATTLRGIAADVNVTAPLLSYYFKSKENLYLRVAGIVMECLEVEVAKALETPRPFCESVVAVVDAQVGLAKRSPAAVEFMFSMLYGPQAGQPAPDLEVMYAGTRQRLVALFERGIATGELRLRRGMNAAFLAEQLGNLIHAHVSMLFKVDRLMKRHPERREQLHSYIESMSLDVALDHFFFGAGDVPALSKT